MLKNFQWDLEYENIHKCAAGHLNLNSNQANTLFIPVNDEASYLVGPFDEAFISAKRAVNVLRHLAKTGKVNWTISEQAA